MCWDWIMKPVRDALEGGRVVQEIKTTEIDVDELVEHLKESGVSKQGISCSTWKTLEGLGRYYGIVITRGGRL
jgi:hypothetical protein